VLAALLIACQAQTCPTAVGELEIHQLSLPGPVPGESTLVVLPDGSRLLIDVGNDSHDGAVREAAGSVDHVLLTHDDEDHTGGVDDLSDVLSDAQLIAGLGEWDLGGAVLRVFLADGLLDVGGEVIDLRDEVEGLSASDNARSVAGTLTWGDFVYLFAGDLTGGGKDTPDVESAVARHAPEVGSIDVLHLSHHGIRSSTNDAWTDWLLPDDGTIRSALVGANRGYLAAPAEEVVQRVGPRLSGGRIWVAGGGRLAHRDEHTEFIDGTVQVAVSQGGSRYRICGEDYTAIP
jgi:beta-lactamase superfamily II metal-dependent hydrolase